MEENRKKADWLIVAIAILALITVSLGGYVVCYFLLSEKVLCGGVGGHTGRIYATEWQATLFKPAAAVESRFHYEEVWTFARPAD